MPINNLPEKDIQQDFNLFLPKLRNQILNAGTAHILKHRSIALELFGNRWRNRTVQFGDTLVIRYNQWQDEMNKLRPDMSHKDLTTGKSYEQHIRMISHGCANEMISVDIMKRAMGSEEMLSDFLADKLAQASERGAYEIDKYFIDQICNDDNYSKTAIFKNKPEFYRPFRETTDGKETFVTDSFRKLINSIIATASAMCNVTSNFNYYGMKSKNMGFKDIGVIISSEIFGQSQDYYGRIMNPAYVELEGMFAWVKVLPIYDPEYNKIAGNEKKPKRNKHVILMSVDGYVMIDDKNSPTGFDTSREIFREVWFYKWLDAFQDVAKGYNMVAWVEEEEKDKEKPKE